MRYPHGKNDSILTSVWYGVSCVSVRCVALFFIVSVVFDALYWMGVNRNPTTWYNESLDHATFYVSVMSTLLFGLMLRTHSYSTGLCYYRVAVVWPHDYLRVNELTLKFMSNIDRNKDTIKQSVTEHYAYWLHTMIMTAKLYFQLDDSDHLVFTHYWHYVYALSHTRH